MNTQETEMLQEELNDLQSVEQVKPQEKQDVVIHVTGFTLFADVKL